MAEGEHISCKHSPINLFSPELDPATPSQIVTATDAVVRDCEELLTVSCPQVGIVEGTFVPVEQAPSHRSLGCEARHSAGIVPRAKPSSCRRENVEVQ